MTLVSFPALGWGFLVGNFPDCGRSSGKILQCLSGGLRTALGFSSHLILLVICLISGDMGSPGPKGKSSVALLTRNVSKGRFKAVSQALAPASRLPGRLSSCRDCRPLGFWGFSDRAGLCVSGASLFLIPPPGSWNSPHKDPECIKGLRLPQLQRAAQGPGTVHNP